jgi:hypothetical protein
MHTQRTVAQEQKNNSLNLFSMTHGEGPVNIQKSSVKARGHVADQGAGGPSGHRPTLQATCLRGGRKGQGREPAPICSTLRASSGFASPMTVPKYSSSGYRP